MDPQRAPTRIFLDEPSPTLQENGGSVTPAPIHPCQDQLAAIGPTPEDGFPLLDMHDNQMSQKGMQRSPKRRVISKEEMAAKKHKH